MDWPKSAKSGWPKRDWPKSVPSVSTPQSGVEAPRLLKRSLTRLYYCCCCCCCLLLLFVFSSCCPPASQTDTRHVLSQREEHAAAGNSMLRQERDEDTDDDLHLVQLGTPHQRIFLCMEGQVRFLPPCSVLNSLLFLLRPAVPVHRLSPFCAAKWELLRQYCSVFVSRREIHACLIDCRKLGDPDCDEKPGIHVGRNPRIIRSTMVSKDYHELRSRLYDGMSRFLSGKNVVIMICKNGRRLSGATVELWS